MSYADFITLLFAFFVVMFANSQSDKGKVAELSRSMKEAFESGALQRALSGMSGDHKIPGEKDQKHDSAAAEMARAELVPSLHRLNEVLKQEVSEGKVQVDLEARGLVISMREAAFFPPASDQLNEDALPIIEKVAASIAAVRNPVRLEGHTDSTPIRSARFQSNWELSAARSIAMLEVLAEMFAISRSRMAIVGFADTVPVAPNDTAEGRQQNRRVDVVILNDFGGKSEPVQKQDEGKGKPSAELSPVVEVPAAPARASVTGLEARTPMTGLEARAPMTGLEARASVTTLEARTPAVRAAAPLPTRIADLPEERPRVAAGPGRGAAVETSAAAYEAVAKPSAFGPTMRKKR